MEEIHSMRLVLTKKELVRAGYGYIYSDYNNSALGFWYDVSKDLETIDEELIKEENSFIGDCASIIHGRLFHERCKLYKVGRRVIMTEQEYQRRML